MYWIVGILLLVLAAFAAGNAVGWHRHKNGLGLWPLSAGKDGIHRQPLIILALLAGALVGCTLELSSSTEPSPDTTATAPRDSADQQDGNHDHDRDHEKGKHKDNHHEDAAKP